MRLALVLASTTTLLSGCLNWQGTYDSAARAECQRIVDATERQACLSAVVDNSWKRNAERRND